MYLTAEQKQEIFKNHGGAATNTGRVEGQIALFTERILHLTQHVKAHHNDKFTNRALVNLVGKRKKLLEYLKEKDIERYRNILKELGLRK